MNNLKTLRGALALSQIPSGYSFPIMVLAFHEEGSNREILVNMHDTIVIHDADGTVHTFNGYEPDYSFNNTLAGARLHGKPKEISLELLNRAIFDGLTVELTPVPALVEIDTAEDGTVFVSGNTEPFCETGTEGIIWSVSDRTKKGYDALFVLKPGDYLTVYEKDGVTVRWQGTVRYDYDEYPHGYQRRLDSKVWVKLFLEQLPATVRRKPRRCAAGKKSGKPNTCGSCACGKKS